MCDTVLRRAYYDGRTIDSFLNKALTSAHGHGVPRMTVPTAQRLAGHIDWDWLNEETAEMLNELQSSEPGKLPLDHLVAPAFRSAEEDFRDCGRVVARLASPRASARWGYYEVAHVNQVTGRVGVVVDAQHLVEIDPRVPTLWREDDYVHIKYREHYGRGRIDHVAGLAKASIELSGFVAVPDISEFYVTATLRQFEIAQD